MKATLISKEDGKAKFTLEFDAKELDDAASAVYKRTKHQYQVDGFRKGKAPRSILEKRFGSGIFLDEAVNDLVNQNYFEGVGELELEVIDQPAMEFSQISKEEGFTVTATVPIYPEVSVDGYKGIEVERVDAEIKESDVEADLASMQRRNARMNSVDRPVQEGDTITLDYTGSVDGVEFEGGSAEEYPLEIGSNSFIPGFEDQLIGKEKDQDVEVHVTFPENYHAEDLAGKDAVFKCLIHEIKERELPELDDEFAKDVSEFDTLEDLKNDIRDRLKDTAKNRAESAMKDKALEAVYQANDIDVPEVMVTDEIDMLVEDYNRQLQMQGMDLEKYCAATGGTLKEVRENLHDEALRRVKTRMIVRAIADAEGVEVSEEELDEQLGRMAEQYDTEKEEVRKILGEENLAYMRGDIRMRKAVDFIMDNAVLVDPKPEEEAEAEAEAETETETKEEE